jgi:CDP-diacylglycerol--serine O-phosphatidyltransferase
MSLRPRFVGFLGLADVVTAANAALGFVAVVVAVDDPTLAARLVLLAAVADGLDGVVARRFGSTPVGGVADSLADVVSFGVAPATLVVVVAREWVAGGGSVGPLTGPVLSALVVGVPALFVAAAVVRLAVYTAEDITERATRGVQTTLAATVLACAYLAGFDQPALLLGGTAVFTYLMVTRVRYPDLREADALGMGVVQVGAITFPTLAAQALPRLLLVAALAYLTLAPSFYPDPDEAEEAEEADDASADPEML